MYQWIQAKYLEEELDDFVDQDFAKPLPCSEELTKEFVLLIEEEQSRLIEYLAAPGVKQLFSPMKYLIQRDALFDQKAQKIKIGKGMYVHIVEYTLCMNMYKHLHAQIKIRVHLLKYIHTFIHT